MGNTVNCKEVIAERNQLNNCVNKIYRQGLEKVARTKRKSRRKHKRRRRPHKKPVEVQILKFKCSRWIRDYDIQVSNFIEEPEEVVYYEESFPSEFDDGVVIDYEEASFDEQVVMLGFYLFSAIHN